MRDFHLFPSIFLLCFAVLQAHYRLPPFTELQPVCGQYIAISYNVFMLQG